MSTRDPRPTQCSMADCVFCLPPAEGLATGLSEGGFETRWDAHPLTDGHQFAPEDPAETAEWERLKAHRCPRCGATRELHEVYGVCRPCAAAAGFDPRCMACVLEGRGEDPNGVRHVPTCAVSARLAASPREEVCEGCGVTHGSTAPTAYERGIYDAGITEGRRQAAEGWDAARLAQLFHETYERLAPDFGYRTREASAKPWAEVPENNRALMTATCAEMLSRLVGPWEPAEQPEGSDRG